MFGDLTRVGSNFHAMQSWSNLKQVNGKIGQIQSRLSTGKRINSAEDDTSGYALSKHLESRVRGMSQALDNVGTGGYQGQMSLLQTVKEKLTQAADGSLSTSQRGAIGDQIDQLLTEVDDIRNDTKFNDYTLFKDSTAAAPNNRSMTFHVGEGNGDTLAVSFDNSNRRDVGEAASAAAADVADIDGVVGAAAGAAASVVTTAWSTLTATQAQTGISEVSVAIKNLAKSIQKLGDYNVRLSSKEESLSVAISNTEATRSRIEDADFAKEQMDLMKLSILQQTTVASFAQSNSSSQMVLALFQ